MMRVGNAGRSPTTTLQGRRPRPVTGDVSARPITPCFILKGARENRMNAGLAMTMALSRPLRSARNSLSDLDLGVDNYLPQEAIDTMVAATHRPPETELAIAVLGIGERARGRATSWRGELPTPEEQP